MNSAGDWGISDPLAVPKARLEMKRRGHSPDTVNKVSLENPKQFLSQSPNFRIEGA
jgi:predicted metal-dependent TIM-barrel fold hydrolase